MYKLFTSKVIKIVSANDVIAATVRKIRFIIFFFKYNITKISFYIYYIKLLAFYMLISSTINLFF